jgi:hypothetical protein
MIGPNTHACHGVWNTCFQYRFPFDSRYHHIPSWRLQFAVKYSVTDWIYFARNTKRHLSFTVHEGQAPYGNARGC